MCNTCVHFCNISKCSVSICLGRGGGGEGGLNTSHCC